MSKIKERKVPDSPEDKSITTFFIGGIDESTSKELLENPFLSFGEVTTVRLIPSKKVAFLTMKNRSDAEKAFQELFDNLAVKVNEEKK